jgi:hypothetical protein
MPDPQHRAIVLGASNVVIGMATVVETARLAWGEPLELLAAIGHGRSYGQSSSVMGRTLPGILQCDVWSEWKERAPLPTAALLTDIGNDILFGAAPPRIASWVRDCLVRLRDSCERLTITELPLDSVLSLGPVRYLALRALLFPSSRITWQQAIDRARELNEHVIALSREFDVLIVRPERCWYGWDPIHIRPRSRCDAWCKILSSWRSSGMRSVDQPSLLERVKWWNARPKSRKIFGVAQHCAQPAIRLADGTTVSLY